MSRRSLALSSLVVVVAILLAFPLRSVVEHTVIIPAAYVLWALGLFYDATPQVLWWAAAVLVAAVIALGALIPKPQYGQRRVPPANEVHGPVELLAGWIGRAPGGIYYKWLVAHRLGELVHRILHQHETQLARSHRTALSSQDWQPPEEVRAYLETGLHGSFADYPRASMWAKAPAPSPLDLEIATAVEFIESQMEPYRDRRS